MNLSRNIEIFFSLVFSGIVSHRESCGHQVYVSVIMREMDVFEEARKKKEAERKEKEKIEEERKEYAKWQVT